MEMSFKLTEINEVAKRLLEFASGQRCFAFHGEMGAGKTTLISALCSQLGVTSGMGSPTFPIINEYVSGQGESVYHIDLYRLKDEGEAMNAGVEDCLLSGYYCFVEWPERAPALLPPDVIQVYITTLDADMRSIRIKVVHSSS